MILQIEKNDDGEFVLPNSIAEATGITISFPEDTAAVVVSDLDVHVCLEGKKIFQKSNGSNGIAISKNPSN